jgi:hypothetical protein
MIERAEPERDRRGHICPEQPKWLVTYAHVREDGTQAAARTMEIDQHPSRFFERLQDELARDKGAGLNYWIDRYVLLFAIPVH